MLLVASSLVQGGYSELSPKAVSLLALFCFVAALFSAAAAAAAVLSKIHKKL